MAETTTELDDLRDEIAEILGDLRRAMKLVTRKNGGGAAGMAANMAGGLARQAAHMATGFAADFVVGRSRLLRRPVERAISSHPFGAAAFAVAAAVMFGRYLVRAPDE